MAPLDGLDAEHDVWREGLVTVMSANLDGAGPLRTVAPSIVVRHWSGRADAASATALARRTGARLALFGRMARAGGDSIRVTMTLLDAEAGTSLAELRVVDSRLDRLADTLTVRVLRELSRSRAIGAVRAATLRARSLPALKAFLVGEQHYRRSEWDSALANYQQAIELDSTFALALYRAGLVLGWISNSSDSLSNDYLLRAGAHNRGLAPRDSLLVLSESLSAALETDLDPAYWRNIRRVYAVTEQLVRRYPRDPEAWFEFGDVRYHNPAFARQVRMREAFDQALGLDSAFAPAYFHSIELALQLGDRDGALRYMDRYAALRPRDIEADGVRLARLLLEPTATHLAAARAVLDTASADLLVSTAQYFRGWDDTSETSIRLARLLPGRRSSTPDYADPEFQRRRLAMSLAYHGHLHDAGAQGSTGSVTHVFAAAAWMGGIGAGHRGAGHGPVTAPAAVPGVARGDARALVGRAPVTARHYASWAGGPIRWRAGTGSWSARMAATHRKGPGRCSPWCTATPAPRFAGSRPSPIPRACAASCTRSPWRSCSMPRGRTIGAASCSRVIRRAACGGTRVSDRRRSGWSTGPAWRRAAAIAGPRARPGSSCTTPGCGGDVVLQKFVREAADALQRTSERD